MHFGLSIKISQRKPILRTLNSFFKISTQNFESSLRTSIPEFSIHYCRLANFEVPSIGLFIAGNRESGPLCVLLDTDNEGRDRAACFGNVFRPKSYTAPGHASRALAKLEVARGSLAVPSQAAAVQKRLAADVALLRTTALVPHVEDEMRLLGVAGAALRTGERPDLLRLMAGGPGIPVAGTLLMAPQMAGLGKALATVLATILSLGAFAARRIIRA